MDFSFSDEHRELAALARSILTDRVAPDRLRELEAKDEPFDRTLWTELATAGVLAAALPAEAGGDGLGLLEQCGVLVELGRAVAPVPYLSSVVTAAAGIARFGDADQIARWAVPAARGDLVLTAALAGEATVRASHTGASWVLNGAVPVVPAAPYADLILVPVDDQVFLVAPGDRGVEVEAQRVSGGEGAGWLELSDVVLAAERVLGGDGVAAWLRARAVVGLCALQLGVTERALELTAEYARTRVQFGKPIGTFQAVAQRLADAYIDVEAIRLTLWQAAWRVHNGLPCPTEVSTAKFWAADAGHRVAHTAVHVHGGVGIDVEHSLHRYFLAAKYNEFALGGAGTHVRHIGAALAARATSAP
jgi:alkylation response protein AidB-like acyl-CoA dehydrogenase